MISKEKEIELLIQKATEITHVKYSDPLEAMEDMYDLETFESIDIYEKFEKLIY